MSRVTRDCLHPRAQHQHGSRAGYLADGCRCWPCTFAAHLAGIAYRNGESWADGAFPAAAGVRLRIEALHAIGWSSTELGKRLGVTRQAVRSLRCHPGEHALQSTLDRVSAVYDELWDKPPTGRHADRIRAWAVEQGFVPPLALDDDTLDQPDARPVVEYRTVIGLRIQIEPRRSVGLDEIAVERITSGTLRDPAASPERREALRRLAARGLTDAEIAARTGLSRDVVCKERERHGIPAGTARRGAA